MTRPCPVVPSRHEMTDRVAVIDAETLATARRVAQRFHDIADKTRIAFPGGAPAEAAWALDIVTTFKAKAAAIEALIAFAEERS